MTQNVSSKTLAALAWILSYRDFIVAAICAILILSALDQPLAVTAPALFLIGWFVPRNAP